MSSVSTPPLRDGEPTQVPFTLDHLLLNEARIFLRPLPALRPGPRTRKIKSGGPGPQSAVLRLSRSHQDGREGGGCSERAAWWRGGGRVGSSLTLALSTWYPRGPAQDWVKRWSLDPLGRRLSTWAGLGRLSPTLLGAGAAEGPGTDIQECGDELELSRRRRERNGVVQTISATLDRPSVGSRSRPQVVLEGGGSGEGRGGQRREAGIL